MQYCYNSILTSYHSLALATYMNIVNLRNLTVSNSVLVL